MTAALAIGFFWVAFAATHVALSSARLRPRLVGTLGEPAFAGVYSVVALATFVPLVWIFATHKHAGPLLWLTLGPPALAQVVTHVVLALAFVFLVGSLLPGSAPPSSMAARGRATAHGLTRITRHPMLIAFALFGIGHLFVNGSLGDVLFFGGFVAFAAIGAWHQDSRKARERPDYAAMMAETSVTPFAAILAGRQRLVLAELPLAALAGGLVLTLVVRLFHRPLFGP